MFRKLATLGLVAALAIGSISCTPEQITANKAKAADVLAAIKQGARVTVATAKEALDGVCANGSTVAGAAAAIRVGFGVQTGPNTSQNLANLDTAMATLNGICSRAAANPNDPAIKQLLSTAMIAYQKAEAAKAAAAKGG